MSKLIFYFDSQRPTARPVSKEEQGERWPIWTRGILWLLLEMWQPQISEYRFQFPGSSMPALVPVAKNEIVKFELKIISTQLNNNRIMNDLSTLFNLHQEPYLQACPNGLGK